MNNIVIDKNIVWVAYGESATSESVNRAPRVINEKLTALIRIINSLNGYLSVYDSTISYFVDEYVSNEEVTKYYKSLISNNINNDLLDTVSWLEIPLSEITNKSYVKTNDFNTIITELREIVGNKVELRYDKKLGSLDILNMLYTNGDLTTIIYQGDNDSTTYYREILTYENNELKMIKHFYNKSNLTTPSATTVLTYLNGELDSAIYSE